MEHMFGSCCFLCLSFCWGGAWFGCGLAAFACTMNKQPAGRWSGCGSPRDAKRTCRGLKQGRVKFAMGAPLSRPPAPSWGLPRRVSAICPVLARDSPPLSLSLSHTLCLDYLQAQPWCREEIWTSSFLQPRWCPHVSWEDLVVTSSSCDCLSTCYTCWHATALRAAICARRWTGIRNAT